MFLDVALVEIQILCKFRQFDDVIKKGTVAATPTMEISDMNVEQ
jgi:hypothetical protein